MATLRLGDTAPDFTQDSTAGKISFHEWAGDSWVVLFSHPADFTPVCTTELGKTAALSGEFAKRNVKPIAISVDPLESHGKWVNDINETQNTTVNFPILADADRKVAGLYDMYGEAAARNIVRQLQERPTLIGPDQTHDWLFCALGLDAYPIVRRQYRGESVEFSPEAVLEYINRRQARSGGAAGSKLE